MLFPLPKKKKNSLSFMENKLITKTKFINRKSPDTPKASSAEGLIGLRNVS